jgi:uncharacterized protein (TIGR02246 family)
LNEVNLGLTETGTEKLRDAKPGRELKPTFDAQSAVAFAGREAYVTNQGSSNTGNSFWQHCGWEGNGVSVGIERDKRRILAKSKTLFNQKEENTMKKIAMVAFLVIAAVAAVLAQVPAPSAKAPSVSQTVKQLEHDWIDAIKAGDADKLGAIFADDWVLLDYDGKKETKQEALADVKSGKMKMESVEFGPMEVKVLGNVAVVQGSDTAKSSYGGKDTSGKYAWMDVFVKRDGKWVAVRSQIAKMM